MAECVFHRPQVLRADTLDSIKEAFFGYCADLVDDCNSGTSLASERH
jgi:hypothetical protein